MAYNLTFVNGTGLQPLADTINTQLMFGWFGVGILITLVIILYMGFLQATQDNKKSLGVATFMGAILSIFMRSLNLLTDQHVLITWIIAGLVAFITFLQE